MNAALKGAAILGGFLEARVAFGFVDVVTEVQHELGLGRLGEERLVRVKVAPIEVLARDEREARTDVVAGEGRGLGAADYAYDALRREAIVVGRGRGEAREFQLRGVVGVWRRGDVPIGHHRRERRVGRDLVVYGERVAGVRNRAYPEDHSVGCRITRGDALRKDSRTRPSIARRPVLHARAPREKTGRRCHHGHEPKAAQHVAPNQRRRHREPRTAVSLRV